MAAKKAKDPQWPASEIVRKKVDTLVPYARNARVHDEAQVAQIAASIKEWGWTNPLLIDPKGGLIAGHGRLLAAQLLGIEEVPCMVARGWTKAQRQAYVIADNQLALAADWDDGLLKLELGELVGLDFNVDLLGFEDKTLSNLLSSNGEVVEDEPPPVPKKATSKLGQLWALGDHRVLCGDATVAAQRETLMGGNAAALMATDPPYGVDYGKIVGSRKNQKKGGWADIENDGLTDDEMANLLDASLGGEQATVAFVWHPAGARRWLFWKALEKNGWRIAQEIVWVKNALVFGRSDYQWRHEPCIYAKKEGSPSQDDRTETTVWEENKPSGSDHPTGKPVALFVRPVKNHSRVGEIAFDPFLGSGTTLIACEQLNRRCFGIEIEPKYVDVVLARWENFTGKKAKLLDEKATN